MATERRRTSGYLVGREICIRNSNKLSYLKQQTSLLREPEVPVRRRLDTYGKAATATAALTIFAIMTERRRTSVSCLMF